MIYGNAGSFLGRYCQILFLELGLGWIENKVDKVNSMLIDGKRNKMLGFTKYLNWVRMKFVKLYENLKGLRMMIYSI